MRDWSKRLGHGAALLALACAAVTAGAQALAADGEATARLLRHGTPHEALFDIAFDGPRGIAVGTFGTLLSSADGGATWVRESLAPANNLALLSVAIVGAHCVVVGQSGLVFIADDCKTWKAVAPIVPARLLSVAMNAQGVAYAVGGFGTILRSADWGKTWAAQSVDWKAFTKDGAEPHLYGVHVAADGTPTLVGEFELILRANAAGTQWKALHKGERSLFALSVGESGRAYAVGQSGAILASSDGGASWRELTSGTEAILTGILAGPKGQLLVSGINTLLLSPDEGASWKPVSSKTIAQGRHQALASGTAADGKTRLLVVGSGGAILELNP